MGGDVFVPPPKDPVVGDPVGAEASTTSGVKRKAVDAGLDDEEGDHGHESAQPKATAKGKG